MGATRFALGCLMSGAYLAAKELKMANMIQNIRPTGAAMRVLSASMISDI